MSDSDEFKSKLKPDSAAAFRKRAIYCANEAYSPEDGGTMAYRQMLTNLSQAYLLLAQDAERREFSI